jgi:hypothetical protein
VKLKVPERGGAVISSTTWRMLSDDPGFIDLVNQYILSGEPARGMPGHWRLRAGAYVGRTTLGGVDVEVVEKVAGAFEAMVRVIAPRSLRFIRAGTKAAEAGRPDDILAAMLIVAAREYLSAGPEAEYRDELLEGAYVTGRLDMRRTIGLRVRGARHKIGFVRSVLDDDTPLNRSLFSALGVLATLHASREFGAEVAASARSLRAWFGRSAIAAAAMPWDEVKSEARSQADVPRDGMAAAREASVLASAVLDGAALSGDRAGRLIPRTWFVNLESLFERFVRKLVSDALGGLVRIGNGQEWPGGGKAPPLFRNLPTRYPSNLDLVINLPGGLVVGDAKYKEFGGWPGASDVHQLLAHAAACEAGRAALFFPSEAGHFERLLGTAVTGCQVWVFALDLCHPPESMSRALRAMGIETA